MFSFKKAILPRNVEDIFTINNQIYGYNTRYANSGDGPYSIEVLNFLIRFHLKFLAIHHWHLLRKKLKAHIINNYQLCHQMRLVINYFI